MSKLAISALASAASALATAALALAGQTNQEDPQQELESTPAKRGRPAKEKEEPEKPKGKTLEELQELISPFVEDGKGDEVKGIIRRHAPSTGTLKELVTLPGNQAAFEKDLKGLAF